MTQTDRRVRVTLNGAPRELDTGTTVATLVARLGRDPRTVAVELNGDILSRALFETTEIREGDRLEVVHFVQGGTGLESGAPGSSKCV